MLTQATGSPAKALEMLGTATDLAAAKHEDLSTAAESLGKVYNGQNRILKEFGVTVTSSAGAHKALETATKGAEAADKTAATSAQKLADVHAELAGKTTLTAAEHIRLRDATAAATDAAGKATTAHTKLTAAQKANHDAAGSNEKAIDTLGKKLSGQASAQADTFTGHLHGIKAAFEDHVAVIGQKYGPALTVAGAAMTGLGATMEVGKAATNALKDVQVIQTAQTELATAATWLLNAAMDAMPIILIVLGLAAVVAAIILAYNKVKWFRDAVDDMGKIAKAAFDDVKNAAVFVFNWLSQNWPLVLAILTGPFGLAVKEISDHWDTIVSDVEAMPGRITNAAVGLFDGIKAAFRGAINGVIDLWNQLHFKLPDINFGPIHLTGPDIGVPNIPHLAQGGLITSTGLIYAHAGEAITPAPLVGRSAPAVHIDTLAVSTEMDIDLFMRRAAWSARTAAL